MNEYETSQVSETCEVYVKPCSIAYHFTSYRFDGASIILRTLVDVQRLPVNAYETSQVSKTCEVYVKPCSIAYHFMSYRFDGASIILRTLIDVQWLAVNE
ncbi:MAG: hypothetical protein M1434_01040 [Chloroflexi bacterium]|nr:hypothetical protein [Chloroflexota bacterium]